MEYLMDTKDWKLIWDTLVMGVRDYLHKNHFTDAVLGLSGGMDSSLVATIVVDAIGKDHVHGVLLPSKWTSASSINDAKELAENLGIETFTIPISPLMQVYEQALSQVFAGKKPDVTEENLQSRIRGNLLMAFSNKFNWIVVATGNKSELAVGYCTLYGDLAGGLAPIADLYKTEVYCLAQWYNTQAMQEIIPNAVFTKAPTAELRPNQTDQDSLPPYADLDRILHAFIEEDRTEEDIVIDGINADTVKEVGRLLARSAFKRHQAPPLLAVGKKAFGINVN